MSTNNTGPMITTLSAKRSRRHLLGEAKKRYAGLKRDAHRRARRSLRIEAYDDGEFEVRDHARRLTGWEVS